MEVFSSVSARLEESWCHVLTKFQYDFKSCLNKKGYNVQLIEDGATISLLGSLKAITAAEVLLFELSNVKSNKEIQSQLQLNDLAKISHSNQSNNCKNFESSKPNLESEEISSSDNADSCIHIELLGQEEETSFHDYCTISLQEVVEPSNNAQNTPIEKTCRSDILEHLTLEHSLHYQKPTQNELPSQSLSSAELNHTGNKDSSSSSDAEAAAETGADLYCSICSYKTNQQNLLERHMKTHFNEEQMSFTELFSCSKCTYKTTRKFHFTRHIRDVHNELKPYLCDLCGKTFKRQDNMKQHRLMHASSEAYVSNVVQFQCNICNKRCHSKAHLKEHQAVHSTTRSFLCEICGASFKTLSVQRKHVSTLHQNPRAFACHLCNKRFSTNYALRRHMKQHPFEIEVLGSEGNDLSENQEEKLSSDDEHSIGCE